MVGKTWERATPQHSKLKRSNIVPFQHPNSASPQQPVDSCKTTLSESLSWWLQIVQAKQITLGVLRNSPRVKTPSEPAILYHEKDTTSSPAGAPIHLPSIHSANVSWGSQPIPPPSSRSTHPHGQYHHPRPSQIYPLHNNSSTPPDVSSPHPILPSSTRCFLSSSSSQSIRNRVSIRHTRSQPAHLPPKPSPPHHLHPPQILAILRDPSSPLPIQHERRGIAANTCIGALSLVGVRLVSCWGRWPVGVRLGVGVQFGVRLTSGSGR